MKKIAAIILVVMFTLLTACNNTQNTGPSPDSPDNRRSPRPERETPPAVLNIKFTNDTIYDFYEIYISPTTSDQWGDDVLGSLGVLSANSSFNVQLPIGNVATYDIRIIDEDFDEYLFSGMTLQDGNEISVYFGYEGLAATVYGQSGNELFSMPGMLSGDPGGGYVSTGTGYDTNGDFYFVVYNESAYDIYAIYVGPLEGEIEDDADVLEEILPAGENVHIYGTALDHIWHITEWTLFIVDVDGDTSISYDVFNLWQLNYVDVFWDGASGGYVSSFIYH